MTQNIQEETNIENVEKHELNKIRYIPKNWYLNVKGNHKSFQQKKYDLIQGLNISDILATFLLNRDIDTVEKAKNFLYGKMEDLHSPFLLTDMKKAIDRIIEAMNNNEKIAYFTDFDCDGTTANSVLGIAFERLGYENTVSYIPHREKEGYGLNCKALKMLKDSGVSLVISADIGITAYKEADYCKEIGLDLIITDHHLPKLPDNYNKDDENQFQYLPQSFALINPNRPDCKYPFKGICGCAVAFKLIQGLWNTLGRDLAELEDLYSIVAIATVADIMPLIDENRIIVKKGIELMNNPNGTGIIGLDALIKVTGYQQINAEAIGFGIAPRINSCGRLDHANLGAELLKTKDYIFASERATAINKLNDRRKELQKEVIEKAYEHITQEYLDNNIIVALPVADVHVGVVGIAAGQITEKLYRPSIIVTDHPELDGYLVGSCRSTKEFNIFNILMECQSVFERDENQKFGGHGQAAGLTIKKEYFKDLVKLLEEYFERNPVESKQLQPKITIDKSIRVEDISKDLMDEIDFLAPYGEGNTPVLLGLKGATCTMVKFYKNDTLGFTLPVDRYRSIKAIGFKMHDKAKDLGLQEDLAYNLDIAFQPAWNEFQGTTQIQVRIEDIKL